MLEESLTGLDKIVGGLVAIIRLIRRRQDV